MKRILVLITLAFTAINASAAEYGCELYEVRGRDNYNMCEQKENCLNELKADEDLTIQLTDGYISSLIYKGDFLAYTVRIRDGKIEMNLQYFDKSKTLEVKETRDFNLEKSETLELQVEEYFNEYDLAKAKLVCGKVKK